MIHRPTICTALPARALLLSLLSLLLALGALLPAAPAALAVEYPILKTDIPGPAGSEAFGELVAVLSNGNFVVVDSLHDIPGAANAGAVYLYNGSTLALISTLTGSTGGDRVGGGSVGTSGVVPLPSGNFLVVSLDWNGGRGAVTWVNGVTGLNGTVSAANSLVGSSASDLVSFGSVTVLTNGNYVVTSPQWQGSTGAATWGSGTTGVTGVVSASNSLVGAQGADESQGGDRIGDGITV
ncbi:MAG: hypothetical protein ACRC1H_14360, partial [Caldilineaceae bacterium]